MGYYMGGSSPEFSSNPIHSDALRKLWLEFVFLYPVGSLEISAVVYFAEDPDTQAATGKITLRYLRQINSKRQLMRTGCNALAANVYVIDVWEMDTGERNHVIIVSRPLDL